VEFRYVNVNGLPDDNAIGGEVHFAKLDNGAWVVRRWFIRLPQGSRSSTPMTVSGATPNVFVRRVGYILREEGGQVTAESMLRRERPAGLHGTVVDSLGHPLSGAIVSLTGTPYRSVVDEQGRFRVDNVTPGTFSVIAEHPGYAQLGIRAAEAEVDLPEGLVSQLHLSAPRMRDVRARLCPAEPAEDDRADLRVVLLDPRGNLVPFARVRITWMTVSGIQRSAVDASRATDEAETDQNGAAMFCGLPANRMLPIFVLRGEERRAVRADSVRLKYREVQARVIRVP
jgi:hypothetical protein